MQIFFGAPAPFAYPSAPAFMAAGPQQPGPQQAGPQQAPNAGAAMSTMMAPSTGASSGGYSLFGNPFGFGGPAPSAGQASGHTVVNSTNALQSNALPTAQPQGAMAANGFTGGFTGGFAGGYLVPAFAAPVMVPGFFVVAMPYAVAAPQSAPVPVANPPAVDVVDTPPAPEPQAAVADAPVVDVEPSPAPVTQDEPQSRALTRLFDGRSEVSFSLSLTTLEGDRVSVEFFQAASAARGFTVDGDNWESVQREPQAGEDGSFQLTIDGELDAVERGAIDALMDDVLALADAFFKGNDSAVTRGLLALNLDGQTLGEMALSLSMSQSVEAQRGYGRDVEALDQLRRSGGERLATLEFLASEQKQLIEQAREILEPASAVRFVRNALGPLLQGAMESLNEALADTFAVSAADADAEPVDASPAQAQARLETPSTTAADQSPED